MLGYTRRLAQDLNRWAKEGLIDQNTAAKLLRDAEQNDRRSFSMGFILVMMAAALICAAVLLVVASNWEMIPRVLRVLNLFAVILVGYVGGAELKRRGHDYVAEAFWLVATVTFGAAMALIGQMYHLVGDEPTAFFTWWVAAVLAVIAFRSGPLTVLAAGIAIVWLFYCRVSDEWSNLRAGGAALGLLVQYAAMMIVLWVLSIWTSSRTSRHMLAASLLVYLAVVASIEGERNGFPTRAFALMAFSAALFAVSMRFSGWMERVLRFERAPLHALFGFLAGAFVVSTSLRDADGPLLLIVTAAIVFAGIVAAAIWAGRTSRALRWLCYIGFAAELLHLYFRMVGGMMGTAGFFVAVAVVLGVIAFFIVRIERRVNNLEPA